MLGFWVCLGMACQGPNPRDRPWRDPVVAGAASAKEGNDGDADGRSKTAAEHAGRLERQRERGRTLRIHMNADPGSLNPLRSPSLWSQRIMMDNVFETLIRYRPIEGQGPGRYQAGLARRWDVSPSGREIRIALQEGAHWQDGRPVTALDVQFSIEAAKTRRGGADYHRAALAGLTGVDIVNRTQVRLRLEHPDAFVLRELAAVPILPEHVYQRKLAQSSGDWIGSGPYRVSRVGDDVELQRDPSYWGAAPAIEKVVFARHQDAAIAMREAKEGHMDIVPEMIREHYPEQLDIPGVAKNFSVLRLMPPEVSYIVLDTTESPFDDGNMRRAIAHLVDWQALVDFAGGLAHPVAGLVWPGGPGNGAAPPVPEFSVEQADTLLDLAGWRDDDGDNVRSRDGQRLMITVLATEEPNAPRDAVLAALRKAGFVIDLRVGSAAVLRNRLRDGEFDLAFVTWSGLVDRDLSPLLATSGRDNYGRYHSPVVDELLANIHGAWEPEQRGPLLATLGQLLSRSMPLVALPAPDPRGLVNKRVRGLSVWGGWFAIRELRLAEDAD